MENSEFQKTEIQQEIQELNIVQTWKLSTRAEYLSLALEDGGERNHITMEHQAAKGKASGNTGVVEGRFSSVSTLPQGRSRGRTSLGDQRGCDNQPP